LDFVELLEEYEVVWLVVFENVMKVVVREYEEVIGFGGFYVFGIEWHESWCIDN